MDTTIPDLSLVDNGNQPLMGERRKRRSTDLGLSHIQELDESMNSSTPVLPSKPIEKVRMKLGNWFKKHFSGKQVFLDEENEEIEIEIVDEENVDESLLNAKNITFVKQHSNTNNNRRVRIEV